jgi:hypothetical protein
MWNVLKITAEVITVLGFNYAVFMWIASMNQTRKDVAEIKNNHLKHITHYLMLICRKLKIDYSFNEGEDGSN